MAQEYARIFAALDGASTQEAVAQRAVTLRTTTRSSCSAT